MSFAAALTVGAALIAMWLDVRLEGRRPASLLRRACHLAAGVAILQVASAGLRYALGADPSDLRQFAVVFVVLLPSIVYAFLSGLWLMRALADVVGLARR
jgi:hypothetical protein